MVFYCCSNLLELFQMSEKKLRMNREIYVKFERSHSKISVLSLELIDYLLTNN